MKEWKEVKFFEHDTEESEKEFEKLQEAGIPTDTQLKLKEEAEDEVMSFQQDK